MSVKVNRFFIGPLTLAQQERRRIARYRYHDAAEVADSHNVSFVIALRILSNRKKNRFMLSRYE